MHTQSLSTYSLLCLQNFVEFSEDRRTVSEEGRAGTPSQGVGEWGSVGGTHWPRTRTVCVGGRGLITEHSTHGTQLLLKPLAM